MNGSSASIALMTVSLACLVGQKKFASGPYIVVCGKLPDKGESLGSADENACFVLYERPPAPVHALHVEYSSPHNVNK